MTTRPKVKACVFDAYGTLLNLNAWVPKVGPQLGAKASWLAETWRSKQLEYAWVSTLTRRHVDFWTCTADALDFALELHDIDPAFRDELLAGYLKCEPYADAAQALRTLREKGIKTAVLSNGSPAMLAGALESAGLCDLLDHSWSIEAIGRYKPCPEAYALACSALRLDSFAIGFVSSNAWDVVGSLRADFTPVWVNRDSRPDEYDLRGRIPEVSSLIDASALLESIGD